MGRVPPALGAEHMQTFQILAPASTHWRRASCEEVSCAQAERGWTMDIDLSTELGQKQAYYIKHHSGRKFTHEKLNDTGMVRLTFPSGQTCFREHKVRLDRQEKYLVRGGDFRGNPRGIPTRVHERPEDWIEDFQESSDRINRLIERG